MTDKHMSMLEKFNTFLKGMDEEENKLFREFILIISNPKGLDMMMNKFEPKDDN